MELNGIIIDRKNVSFISFPQVTQDEVRPRVVLKNGEILDIWLTLDYRNFDFSGKTFSFYGLDDENSQTQESTDCVFLITTTIYGGTKVIEKIIYKDDEILDCLLS